MRYKDPSKPDWEREAIDLFDGPKPSLGPRTRESITKEIERALDSAYQKGINAGINAGKKNACKALQHILISHRRSIEEKERQILEVIG